MSLRKREPSHKVPSYKVLSHKVPTYKVPSHKVPSYKVPSYKVPSHKVPSYKVPSYRFPCQLSVLPAQEGGSFYTLAWETPTCKTTPRMGYNVLLGKCRKET